MTSGENGPLVHRRAYIICGRDGGQTEMHNDIVDVTK